MFACYECLRAMETLAPEQGLSASSVKLQHTEVCRIASQAAWGTDRPHGRGRTLKGIVELEGRSGPAPALPYPRLAVEETKRWLGHLVEAAIRTESELVAHIGGTDDELGVRYPPDVEALVRAFQAVGSRLEKETGVASNEAAYESLARARWRTPDAIRKAFKNQPDWGGLGSGDPRELFLYPSPIPGAPRIFLDIEELERRHGVVWDQVVRPKGS